LFLRETTRAPVNYLTSLASKKNDRKIGKKKKGENKGKVLGESKVIGCHPL
jgi:hypothetical protein